MNDGKPLTFEKFFQVENSGLDTNRDGKITLYEVKTKLWQDQAKGKVQLDDGWEEAVAEQFAVTRQGRLRKAKDKGWRDWVSKSLPMGSRADT